MKSDFGDGLACRIIFTAIAAAIISGFCAVGAYSDWERQAVEHGAAEYVIADPKTGAVEFRWREGK